jgi:OOP family OmpA-OmpF porin
MKRLLTSSILAASLASGAAFAQVGPYVGVSVGQSNYGASNCVGQCDKTDIGMKLYGGYMFSEYLGVEAHYGAYGSANLNTTTVVNFTPYNALAKISASSLNGYVLGQIPFDNFRLFGKVGFAYMNTKADVTIPPQPGLLIGYGNSDTTSSTQFAFGLGGMWMINKNWGVRAEWENMKYQYANAGQQTLTFLSIGAQYNF